jgi:hypothetical protein
MTSSADPMRSLPVSGSSVPPACRTPLRPALSPRSVSVLLLLPATALLEPTAFGRTQELLATNSGFLGWLVFNSFMAYAVNLTNFMVTKYTSALTLQVSAWCSPQELNAGAVTWPTGTRALDKHSGSYPPHMLVVGMTRMGERRKQHGIALSYLTSQPTPQTRCSAT